MLYGLYVNKFDLNNRVALITGGAGLLGREHARALLESGATVVITDLDINRLSDAENDMLTDDFSDRLIFLEMDVTDCSSIHSANEEICSKFGGVDILVNNAAVDPKVDANGGLTEMSRFENFPLEQWNFQLARSQDQLHPTPQHQAHREPCETEPLLPWPSLLASAVPVR